MGSLNRVAPYSTGEITSGKAGCVMMLAGQLFLVAVTFGFVHSNVIQFLILWFGVVLKS